MEICQEATEELQGWLKKFTQENRNSLTTWLDLPSFEEFLKELENIHVTWDHFKAVIPTTTKLFMEMEIGSRKMPQFKIISSMNSFLESIHDKYAKAREGYVLGTVLS